MQTNLRLLMIIFFKTSPIITKITQRICITVSLSENYCIYLAT
nr:MAG TPA: hypothetical protein [Caudoviricetes sp.]